ncbi:MAG: CoA transferase [Burkholderiaceae bacterium]
MQQDNTHGGLPLPFEGLRVLDVSQGIAGPYCAQVLWQQGADVIKVEPPTGDWGRSIGIPRGQLSALSAAYNGGKRALALDASTPAGKALLLELALQADVLVQNYRPGVAERLGIGAQALLASKPSLVYVSVSGYGPDGPYAKLAATDSVLQADSGLMHSNRDLATGQPRKVGLLLADVATGLYAAQAASASLYRQARGGPGGHVQVSLFDSSIAFQAFNLSDFNLAPDAPASVVSAPNGTFHARDGYMNMAVLNDTQFAGLCTALAQPQWRDDPRFATAAARLAHAATINGLVAEVLATGDREHWVARLREQDILHSVVRDYRDLYAHPQAIAQQTFQTLRHPAQPAPAEDGRVAADDRVFELRLPGMPDRGTRRPLAPSPAIGEHSVAILREAGLDAARIDRLLADKVVVQRAEPSA